jgi:polar amino acid transport system substrate-binding protein
MKKTLKMMLVATALIFLATGYSLAADDVLSEIMAAKEIKVSTDPNYAPQSFIAANGELDGFDIDVAKEVAKRLGVKVKFITPEWDMITSGKWGKRWDLSIGSMTITPERMQILYFTHPYYYTPAQFAVHKDNTTIKTVADMAGKKIGVCSECTYERWLNKTLKLADREVKFANWDAGEIRTYGTDADAIQDLSLGDGARLDAVLSAKSTIHEAIVKGCNGGCPMKMVGDPVFYEALAFALDKSRPESSDSYLAKLNEIVDSMHKDGTLTKLSMKWYGVDLTKE